MSTIASHFTKFQVGAAATAITAAAVLTPAAIAQAKPDLMPATPVLNSISTDLFGTDPILGPVSFSLDAPVVPWWVGGNNANAVSTLATPGSTTIFEFSPLSLVPGFFKPLVGWFLNFVPHFSVCIGGLGVSVGPYATLSVKTGAC
jgi:hypothetical protein